MSMEDDGYPAFPVVSDEFGHYSGMSLRDWLAGQALVGVLVKGHPDYHGPDGSLIVAADAYSIADAMLNARPASS